MLRAVGIQYGLPFGSILNPDEQSIVPRAWKLVHGDPDVQSPWEIASFLELKTVWHPVGQ